MKKIFINVTAGAAAIGLALVGAQAANAATLYDNQNYAGSAFSATTAANVGSLNDKASSLQNAGTRTYFEDSGYLGRKVVLSGNYNSLQSISSNLHFGETWNDRISSFN
ncbi:MULTISPECIES: peptidase inhibitor family I36 protein [unclassified Rathayibacter]|uniref:peptidase inhibitor family I36 protein n=1 Tax=unclassified Rathayibacter TaxID=2609250 RepID=UPI00188BCE9E|nr:MULTISPECIES: peptidase inhibitor family I36 protein [unclassified Rathayibacter]MBF4463204.1 hypothetical protein [Rathayibacter sp. VKM Ac-2879]MBF4504559.1 hypothetical protein [Rathayibacter sp. VKM Ac-2878]